MAIKAVLVTGGAGYIGSHLVDRLVSDGYAVTVLDNLEPQVHRSGTWPSYANAGARYVRGDVRDRAVFEPLILAADAVVHFGAAVSVGQSMYQVDRYVDVNTRGTALLLDILVNAKHHVQKVLVASSIGVYGEGAYACEACGPVAPGIRAPEQLAERDWEQHCPRCGRHVASIPTPEDKALYRDNIYSMTKYHQEEMVLLIGKTYGIPAVAPRFFNVYGPRQSLSNPYAGVAAIWLSRLLNGKEPVVFEDGGQLRDFVSIHDVVDCLVLMLEKPGADYLPVNVGSGETVTILDIARLLGRLLGTTIEPKVTNTGRKFDIRHNTADIARARTTLGFSPKVSLEQGFGELIEWAKTTPDRAEDFFDRALQELQDKGLLVQGVLDAVSRAARHTVADGVLVVAVFAAAFFYRFNTLGGALGGFTNDEFGYLARGRQIQSGELPFRDFNDPGWILTDTLSGLAQWLGGYNLRSEALLTVGMLSLGAAITFVLARKVSGSSVAALLASVILITLDARHYNYPKIVLYAAGIALAWAYAEHPGRGRLAALGGFVGLAFLFRHDNLVYLGAFVLLTLGLVHRRSVRDAWGAVTGAGTAAALFVVPFLLFLALNGGVTEYFRSALVYVVRDAERTSFTLPRLALDFSKPLVAWSNGTPSTPARINVRWSPMPEAERRAREARYRLESGEAIDGTTWTYVLADRSARNIESLVGDPLAEDTHGLDRTAFTVAGTSSPSRLATPLDTVPNATAFLYYCFLCLPALAALVLWRLRRVTGATRVLRDPEYMVPLLVLAALLNIGFMSRGSTNIRIPDVGVTAAILLAWLSTALLSRDGHSILPARPARALARAAVMAGLCLTALSANGLAQGTRTARDAGFVDGPVELVVRAKSAWDVLGVDPSALTADDEQPDVLRIAGYVQACTAPGDRLFVLGEYPLLYYFSDRLFAGGHAWLLPLYYTGDEDESRIVARLMSARVPIVLTEGRSSYDEDYRPVFEQVHAYLEREYREAGEVAVDGSRRLRVLVSTDLQPVRRYGPLELPCFR